MKINIIGAGPAGLYFAIYIKNKIPTAEITLYEKKAREAENGLGYVIQQELVQDLYQLDQEHIGELLEETSNQWNTAEIIAKEECLKIKFPLSAGLKRKTLITYLQKLAENRKIKINYNTILTPNNIEELRRSADLLVGADGIHSIVREQYKNHFEISTINGSNSFLWLKTKNRREYMNIALNEYKNNAYVTTSYPIGQDNTNCTILECNTKSLEETGFNNENGLTNIRTAVAQSFFNVLSPYTIEEQQLRWLTNNLNNCNNLSFDNIALIGESGIFPHYSMGAGLTCTFVASQHLADYIKQTDNTKEAIRIYNNTITPFLKNTQTQSLNKMKWLENINNHYKSLDGYDLINSFRFSQGRKE